MPQAQQGPALAEVSRQVGTFLEALGAAGLTPGRVSGDSTPTPWRSHEGVGMNEIRPGMTPVFDRASL
jgi:D-serine deaminase-like pyridoxal phosphate-dependent protein